MVFQDYKLLPNRTVYDNVAYSLQVIGESRKEIRRKVPDILRLVGLSTKLHNYPDELSGGEQQRVSVARAFVNHPPLLLADEPTGNLDPETSIGIMQLIYRINRTGTTVIVATHDKEMVDKMRRRVIELREGRIVRDELSGPLPARRVHHRVRGAPARRARHRRRGPSQLGHALDLLPREALRGLRRSSAPALAALLTVLLTAVVLGVFIPIVQATTGTANEVRSRVVVDVYIKDSATAQERADLRSAIQSTANVKSVEFISKAEALARAKKKNPEAFQAGAELLGSNPLPASFRVTPEDPDKLDQIVQRLNAGRRAQLAAIDEVRDREEDTDKILSATGLVKALTAGLAVLLILASIALIANTIRLSVFARRREVEVMKLVGATNWFIRWPFVIEGMIVGFFGGLLAVLLLCDREDDLRRPALGRASLCWPRPNTIDFRLLVVVLHAGLHRGVGARERHHAAPLPPRLARLKAAPTSLHPTCRRAFSHSSPPRALAAGLWLGGHPADLPGPVARRVRAGGPRAARRDHRHDREQLLQAGERAKLDDASLKGIVASLDDPYSTYFTPKEARQFDEDVSGHFEGVGMNVEQDKRGLKVLTRVRRLARQGRPHAARRPDRRGRRAARSRA